MPQNVAEVVAGFGTLYIAPQTVAIPTLTGNPAADFAAFDTPDTSRFQNIDSSKNGPEPSGTGVSSPIIESEPPHAATKRQMYPRIAISLPYFWRRK